MNDQQQPAGDDMALPQKRTVKSHKVHDDFPEGVDIAFKIACIGLGQGGGNIAETFWKLGYRRVLAVNTTQSDLAPLDPDLPKLDLRTGGAGQDMVKGRQFLEEHEEEVWQEMIRAIGDDLDYLLVCVSLGGGTGSGGAAHLISIARKYMADRGKDPSHVGAVVSLPNPYEGQRKCRNAVQAFHEVHKLNPSPLVIIDNKRVEELYELPASELFTQCNNLVIRRFHLFNRLAEQRSNLQAFDRADFASLLDGGTVVFGAAPVDSYKTQADLSANVREQLNQTVLAEVDLRQAQQAGCIFMGGENVINTVPMAYFGEAFKSLTRLMAPDSVIYQGVYVDPDENRKDMLACYTMLSGLGQPTRRLEELRQQGRISESSGGGPSVADQLDVGD